MSLFGLFRPFLRGIAERVVRRKLGGYRVDVATPDANKPERPSSPRSVAVVGGGLAGLTAAEALARRGFSVTVFERARSLGGKIGGGFARDPDGTEVAIDHGFHAYFRHYDNLQRLMARAGIAPMAPIDDYVIVGRDGEVLRFAGISTTPLLNVLSLGEKGFFRMREVMPRRTRTQMHELLQYDPERTFRDFDEESFATFADRAALPPRLRRIFATFARAFFADEHRMSAAELIRAFHFYYLSHDRGLLYDHPTGDAHSAVVAPLEQLLRSLGVRFELGYDVARLGLDDEGVRVERAGEGSAESCGLASNEAAREGARFDFCVLATHAMATRAIAEASPDLARSIPHAAGKLSKLQRGARYAVLRLWLDRDPCADLPVFASTERFVLLDAVASYHRITAADRAWSARSGGAALELHSYAVPDDIADADVERAMQAELSRFFPAAASARVLGSHLAIRDDFTARHVGMAKSRPGTRTEDPRIVLAGDWVDLPVPALLMEGACCSGLFAANAILDAEGLSREAISSVPLRGIFATSDHAPASTDR